MAYTFPEIKRQIFNWTFLKDVSISFNFNLPEKEINLPALSLFFENTFSLKGISPDELNTGIRVQSEDKCVCFDFFHNKLDLKIRFPLYKDFSVMLSWLPTIKNYFEALDITEVSQLSIRKYNELSYSFPEGHGDVSIAMKEIFSNSLLGDSFDNVAQSFRNLNRWERKMAITDEITNSAVNIIYGFCEKNNLPNSGALTLTTIVHSLNSSTKIVNLKSRLEDLNQIIDRAFRWCVTDGIINKMQAAK